MSKVNEYYIVIESRPHDVSRYKVCMEVYNQYCLIGRRLTRKANRCKKLETDNKRLEKKNESLIREVKEKDEIIFAYESVRAPMSDLGDCEVMATFQIKVTLKDSKYCNDCPCWFTDKNGTFCKAGMGILYYRDMNIVRPDECKIKHIGMYKVGGVK